MKLYVAGKWSSKKEINQKIQELESMGHEITHNWTANNDNKRLSSVLDIDGVKNADCIVAIMDDPEYPYRGTFCEIGCALGLGKHVYIYNPSLKTKEVCFAHHPLVKVITDWNFFVNKNDSSTKIIENSNHVEANHESKQP